MQHYRKILFLIIILCQPLISFAQKQDEVLFKFGVMADPQYCDCENKEGSRKYKLSLNKLPEAVKAFNNENLEFVVNLGDFIDRDWESYQPLKKITKNLEVPLYHVVGNHDYEVEEQYKDQVPGMLGLENRYYDFKKQNWRFVALDGTNVSLYGTPKNSREHKRAEKMLEKLKKKNVANAQNWNGAVGKKQLQWLKKVLRQSQRNNEKVILLCHFPTYPLDNPHNIWDDDRLVKTINQYDNVVAYFNGHFHKGDYEKAGNVHYLGFHGMVELETNAYAIVSVYEDRLEIKGFGREQDRTLKIE